jgi:endo-1,4-beta-mannosidase
VELFPEDRAERYYQKVFDLLISNGISGAFVWCFSDFEPLLWDSPPFDHRVHERYFGLFRWDGSAKEAAGLIPKLDRQTTENESNLDWIDIKPDEYYEQPKEHIERLFRRFKDRMNK